jgi:hypothetical protein
MTQVTVKFSYEPEDPDDDDRTGMSEEEYSDFTEKLMALGAEDIEIEKAHEVPA